VVATFNQGDPQSNLYESDIVCTTLKSSGTGKDVEGLRSVILTVAIDSPDANEQARGRLRYIDNDTPVEFNYLSCQSIDTHMQYSDNKSLDDFKDFKRVFIKEPL